MGTGRTYVRILGLSRGSEFSAGDLGFRVKVLDGPKSPPERAT